MFANDAAITLLLQGAVLHERHDHWQLEGRRMYPRFRYATAD
ncbi:hypothetical protein LBMAG40_15810 [Cyanobium sp.]|nr:hypothetical protein LBMAG40_15810 [Cyanobium sp.]